MNPFSETPITIVMWVEIDEKQIGFIIGLFAGFLIMIRIVDRYEIKTGAKGRIFIKVDKFTDKPWERRISRPWI